MWLLLCLITLSFLKLSTCSFLSISVVTVRSLDEESAYAAILKRLQLERVGVCEAEDPVQPTFTPPDKSTDTLDSGAQPRRRSGHEPLTIERRNARVINRKHLGSYMNDIDVFLVC